MPITLRRSLLATLLLALLVSGGSVRAGASSPAGGEEGGWSAAGRRDPILFVHGWRGDGAQWRTMRARFRADGWSDAELFAWTFEPTASNVRNSARISARVDQILVATGATRVDIVTHSMGSLSSRHYLKDVGNARKVDAWVSLGGPNHGTLTAELCPSAACREMRRGSPFLLALNRGDETPGPTRYATWASPCDELIDPAESVALDGAVNHRTGCITHMELLRDSSVYAAVRDFVAGPRSPAQPGRR